MDGAMEHIPVLYDEVLAGLRIRSGGRYIDATVGTAGHAAGILQASAPHGQLLGLDADLEAISFAQQVLRPFGDRVSLRAANFRHLRGMALALGLEQVDGILLDLGLSSRQLQDAERGFSFRQDGPLDMRMDRRQGQTAADLVNQLPEAELAGLLWQYGEERHARRIARAIIAARPLATTGELADIVARTIGRRERIDPATRTFQALRIAVNDELAAVAQVLPQGLDISFHSLEDRLVKRFFQQEAKDCLCPPEAPICVCEHRATLRIVTRKPVRPTADEITRNPRSRSARLRIAERLARP
jgi:16S rRNA (cytosine1402-N4)-methyltransferase